MSFVLVLMFVVMDYEIIIKKGESSSSSCESGQ